MKKNLICLSFLIAALFIARQGYSFSLVQVKAPSSSPLRSLDEEPSIPSSGDCSAYSDANELMCCRRNLAEGKNPSDSCSTLPPPPPTSRPDTYPEVTCSVVPDPYNKCCRVDGGKLIFLPIESCIDTNDKISSGDDPILCRVFFDASSGAGDAKINDCRNDCCDTCTAGGTICIQDCLKICNPTPIPPPPVTADPEATPGAAPDAAPEATPGAGGTTTDGNSITTGQGGDVVTRNAVDGTGVGSGGETPVAEAWSLTGGGGCSLLR